MSNSVLPQEGSQQQVTSQTKVLQDPAGGLQIQIALIAKKFGILFVTLKT